MMPDKFQPGDRVRCVQKHMTINSNQRKVAIGQIYTVKRAALYSVNCIILREIDDQYPTQFGWFFHQDDFELVNGQQDPNDA